MTRTKTHTHTIQTNIKRVPPQEVKRRRKRIAAIPVSIADVARESGMSYSLSLRYFSGYNSSAKVEAAISRLEAKAKGKRNGRPRRKP